MAKAQAASKAAVKQVAASKPRVRASKKDTVPLPKPKEVTPKEIRGKVILLSLNCRHFHARLHVKSSEVDAGDADKNWISVTKKLLESETLTKVNRVLQRARLWLETHALSANFFKKGIYAIPKPTLEEAFAELGKMQKEHGQLADEFAEKEYEPAIAEAKKRLGKKFFQQEDYPSKEAIRSAFAMAWETVTMDVPVDLEDINAQIYQQEQRKAEQKWEKAGEQWEQLMRAQYLEAVSHLVEILTPTKDGKLKVFREAALDKIVEFNKTYNPRNVTNDVQLEAMVKMSRELVRGKTMADLKDDEHAREMLRSRFQTVKNTLSTMVTIAPSREVSFDD